MPRPANPGPPYRRGGRPSADGWNRMVELSGPITVEPPLYARATSSGVTIRLDTQLDGWAKIASAGDDSGSYNLTATYPAPGGTWTDGGPLGTGWEVNGTGGIAAGIRVRVWYEPAIQAYAFQMSNCP